MREYRVKVTVRNNLLLSAIEEAGFKSQAEFARSADMTMSQVNNLVGMREAPINSEGSFTPAAKKFMEVLGACPLDLWTEEQLTMELRRNTVEKELSKEAVMMALEMNCQSLVGFESCEDNLNKEDFKRTMNHYLDSLLPRERKVLRLRFGLDTDDEKSLEEIGDMFDLSRTRIQQIESQALRHMRHPSRSKELQTYLEEDK